MEATWVVLANDCRLRVFKIQGSDGIFHEIVDFLSPKGKIDIKKNFETVQPDLFKRSHSACADSNEADVGNALTHQGNLFSKQISGYIERARINRCFTKMRIVGSRGFLKLLREDMTEN